MAAFFQISFGWLAREVAIIFAQLPFGAAVGAVTERLSRRPHRHARLRNIIAKTAVAYASVSFVLGRPVPLLWALGATSGGDGTSHAPPISTGTLLLLAMRILAFASGVIVGTALQPVGLTGGIATGKSTVSSLLQSPSSNADRGNIEEEAEFIVIDVDGIAHDILLPHKLGQYSVYKRLVCEFGTDILTKEEGGDTTPPIDRRKLGDVVFKDRQKRRKINSITHPTIIKIMLRRILLEGLNLKRFKAPTMSRKRRVVCVDIPLLFEGGLPMRLLFGTIIVVACNPELQLKRLHERNPDLTLEQCRQRIASQIPVEAKARKAQVVVRNDGSLKELKGRVREAKEHIANAVAGPQRGAELSCLVLGIGGLILGGIAIG